jgi:hypothetical protein
MLARLLLSQIVTLLVATSLVALFCIDNKPAKAGPGVRKSVIETSHRVQFHPTESRARLIVRRDFRIRSSLNRPFRLELPPHTSVRNLRVLQAGHWHRAELLDESAGHAAFEDALVAQPEGPAMEIGASALASTKPTSTRFAPLLIVKQQNAMVVKLPPLNRKTTRVSIEYELLAPSCYSNDWHHVAYPVVESEPDDDISFVRPTLRGASAVVADRYMPNDSEFFLQQACHNNAPKALVAKWPAKRPRAGQNIRLRTSWETMSMPKGVKEDIRFGRLEFEAASRLSDVPTRGQFVFILDGSYSAHDPKLAAQLKIVRGLLHHVPDAEVQVVLMQRHATVLFERFIAARDFNRAIRRSRHALVAANGSNVEQALSVANHLLSRRKGPLRIIAIGDGKWRSSYTAAMGESALHGMPSRVVVHWLAFEDSPGADYFTVEDTEDPMHRLAHQHGGQGFSVDGTPRTRLATASELEKVVRPMQIRNFRIAAAEWSNEFEGRTVRGGLGYREMYSDATLPDAIMLQGEVWSQPWIRVVERAKNSSGLGALAIGYGVALTQLSDSSLVAFSQAVHVLSRATSFFVRDPEGLYEPNPAGLGIGGIGEGFT